MSKSPCIEIVSYELKPQTELARYEEAVHWLQRKLAEIPGFVSRQVFRCPESGEWTELAVWEDKDAARRGEQQLMSSPDMQENMALIDESTIRLRYMDPVI